MAQDPFVQMLRLNLVFFEELVGQLSGEVSAFTISL